MTKFRKWVRRTGFALWLGVLILLALCWKCDSCLPTNSIDAGDGRIAVGALKGAKKTPKFGEIWLSWGNAESAGYLFVVEGKSPQHTEPDLLEIVRTTNWKRTDRSYAADGDWSVDPDPHVIIDWGWRPAGLGVTKWHFYQGNDEDEKDQLLVQASTSKVLLGYVVTSVGFWVIHVGLRLLRPKRRGFVIISLAPKPAEESAAETVVDGNLQNMTVGRNDKDEAVQLPNPAYVKP